MATTIQANATLTVSLIFSVVWAQRADTSWRSHQGSESRWERGVLTARRRSSQTLSYIRAAWEALTVPTPGHTPDELNYNAWELGICVFKRSPVNPKVWPSWGPPLTQRTIGTVSDFGSPGLPFPASHYCPFLKGTLAAVQASIMVQNKPIVCHNEGLCLLNTLLLSDTKGSSLKHQANSNRHRKVNNPMKEYLHNTVMINVR